MKKEYASLESELAAYGACDPVKLEEKKRAVILAKEAAARWTGMNSTLKSYGRPHNLAHYALDNYLVLLSHVMRQGIAEMADIRAYLGVNEEYEDIDIT